MGLAGPRKRAKISNDPNNTTWSRSTTGFGHTLLRSQGWTPGEKLGAKNAHHAHLYTPASSSHIKVLLREDNLGLGAKRGSGQEAGQCVGLDAFQGLLGRLNGKTEDVLQKEQNSRDAVKRVLYSDRRWGSMRFVSGGILAGNELDQLTNTPMVSAKPEGMVERSIQDDQEKTEALEANIPAKQRDSDSGSLEERSTKREKQKSKKRKRDSRSMPDKEQQLEEAVDQSTKNPIDSEKKLRREAKALRRAEKAKKKLERQQKKAMKLGEQASGTAISLPQHPESTNSISEGKNIGAVGSIMESPGTNLCSEKVVAAKFGRHAVRSKFINQKKLAVRDTKALNEIFMIKAK